MAKDETFTLIIFTLLLDLGSGALVISKDSDSLLQGKLLFVSCRDEGGKSVMWQGPKGRLGTYTRPKVEDHSIGKLLIFNNTKVDEAGNYTCSLTNSRQDAKIFSLKVEEPITFMDTPQIQTGKEGETVTLRCEVSGPNTITWTLGTGNITAPKYDIIGDGLVINNLSRADGNNSYNCRAIQRNTGTTVDREIKLIVEHEPERPYAVYEEDNEVFATLGTKVNLTCQAYAVPPPTFEWSIVDSKHRRIGHILSVSNYTSVLELFMTKKTPATYQCIATNKHGKLEVFYNLHIGTQPEPPLDIEFINSTAHTLELNVTLPEITEEDQMYGMELTGFIVRYRKNSEDWDDQEFNITEDTVILENLQSKTKYEVQAATKNIAGISEYTNSSFFETSTAYCVHKNSASYFPSVIFVSFLLFITSGL